jgi:hypothetical protein
MLCHVQMSASALLTIYLKRYCIRFKILKFVDDGFYCTPTFPLYVYDFLVGRLSLLFHMSVWHPVACVIEGAINTVYTTLF